MRTAPLALSLLILFVGCQAKDSDKAATKERDKTTAEKAFDAGQRAKKKAEAIKAEQEKKNKETNDAGN